MDIKTPEELLKELQRPDERSLRSTPLGAGAAARPADAAAFLQQTIGHIDLAEQVPDRVREAFEQVRTVFGRGVLLYDLYAIAHDRARLVVEYALRERFMDFHGGSVTFLDASSTPHRRSPASFADLVKLLPANRLRKPHSWKLQLSDKTTMWFNGRFDSLVRWARAEKLLHGQRNRHHESILKDARDRIAHSSGYHLLPPEHAAQAIGELAEIINRLWGANTPGGRFYPAPATRDVVAIGWSHDGKIVAWAPFIDFDPAFPPEGLTYVLVKAKANDDEVSHYDSRYESTYIPCELLWGPGQWPDAAAWFERERPAGDQVDILDRLFLVRHHERRLYLPCSPRIAAGLEPGEQGGTWYLVCADAPLDAFNHLRCLLACGSACALADPCRRGSHTAKGPCSSERCPVDTLYTGTLLGCLDHMPGGAPTPRQNPDVRVSPRMPRYNIIEHGTWRVPSD